MTVQYIKDTIKQSIKPKNKQEESNHNFVSRFMESWNIFMTPELDEIFNNYSSKLNKDFNNI